MQSLTFVRLEGKLDLCDSQCTFDKLYFSSSFPQAAIQANKHIEYGLMSSWYFHRSICLRHTAMDEPTLSLHIFWLLNTHDEISFCTHTSAQWDHWWLRWPYDNLFFSSWCRKLAKAALLTGSLAESELPTKDVFHPQWLRCFLQEAATFPYLAPDKALCHSTVYCYQRLLPSQMENCLRCSAVQKCALAPANGILIHTIFYFSLWMEKWIVLQRCSRSNEVVHFQW